LSARDKHGAEIDCDLLAAVYVELLGGRQPGLDFAVARQIGNAAATAIAALRPMRPPRPHQPTPEELAAHLVLLTTIPNPLWASPD